MAAIFSPTIGAEAGMRVEAKAPSTEMDHTGSPCVYSRDLIYPALWELACPRKAVGSAFPREMAMRGFWMRSTEFRCPEAGKAA
jgi:hypothetical protein